MHVFVLEKPFKSGSRPHRRMEIGIGRIHVSLTIKSNNLLKVILRREWTQSITSTRWSPWATRMSSNPMSMFCLHRFCPHSLVQVLQREATRKMPLQQMLFNLKTRQLSSLYCVKVSLLGLGPMYLLLYD